VEKTFGKDYCLPIYGNEECIPGQKQKDQSRKEIGKMSGQRLEYSANEIKDRTHAGVLVQRLAKEYQEDHPDASDAKALSAVCNSPSHARLVAIYLDHPLTPRVKPFGIVFR